MNTKCWLVEMSNDRENWTVVKATNEEKEAVHAMAIVSNNGSTARISAVHTLREGAQCALDWAIIMFDRDACAEQMDATGLNSEDEEDAAWQKRRELCGEANIVAGRMLAWAKKFMGLDGAAVVHVPGKCGDEFCDHGDLFRCYHPRGHDGDHAGNCVVQAEHADGSKSTWASWGSALKQKSHTASFKSHPVVIGIGGHSDEPKQEPKL